MSIHAAVSAATPEIYVVKDSKDPPMVSVGGTIVPYKQVTLAAQIPGRVKTIAGTEGSAFTSGALLVAIDDAELIAQRNASVAELANAENGLRAAQVAYQRELYSPRSRSIQGGMGLPSMFDQMFTKPFAEAAGVTDPYVERRADLYQSGSQIREAWNAIQSAQSRVRAIDAKLRDARSLAPFNGVITQKFVEEGDTVQPGQPLLTFADVEFLQLVVDVPSRLVAGLREKQLLNGRLDISGIEVPVKVAQIFPMADATRHTVTVKLDVPQGFGAPGMYSTVQIPDYTSNMLAAPVIPKSAVRYFGSLPRVYVQTSDGKRIPRLVRLGEEKGNDFVTVLAGVTPGDQIVVNPEELDPALAERETPSR
ncbi:MAG: efflux RND transporter periplasmic adaptor subunit [Chromatiales bacterium]|nr:efflux RND transporter periplasmic adaptor subunit [Chromatiales bacterium]